MVTLGICQDAKRGTQTAAALARSGAHFYDERLTSIMEGNPSAIASEHARPVGILVDRSYVMLISYSLKRRLMNTFVRRLRNCVDLKPSSQAYPNCPLMRATTLCSRNYTSETKNRSTV